MKFARNATIGGLVMALACFFAGCGDGGDTAPPSQSEMESAEAAVKSLQQMTPPPAPGDVGKKGKHR